VSADDVPAEAARLGRVFARQDGAKSIGLFYRDTFLRVVPADDPGGRATRMQTADRLGLNPDHITVLTICNDHPGVAAVDCVDHED
jgi:hypothetical protein